MFCKQRYTDIRLSGLLIKLDEIWVLHLGFMKNSMTGFNSCLDGALPVIVPFLFISHHSGASEKLVYRSRVWANTESHHSAEHYVTFRVRVGIAPFTFIKKFYELVAVFLFPQTANNIKISLTAVTLGAILRLLFFRISLSKVERIAVAHSQSDLSSITLPV